MIRRLRESLAFRLLGRAGVSSLVNSRGESVFEMRLRVNSAVAEITKNVVRHGPMTGLQLVGTQGWNKLDRASMLLGLYEQELLERLADGFADRAPFVDIGGGDGYYCVGALKKGWCANAVCFEQSEERRSIIAACADANGVADRLTIYGAADETMFDKVCKALGASAGKARYLIDIEGFEFELLDEQLLGRLRNSHIFIEIHRWADPDGKKIPALRERASEFFDIRPIETGPRNPNIYGELAEMPDNDRWIICSEGRLLPGLWWELYPRDLPAGQRNGESS